MQIVRAAERRTSTTPNATMTTLASPTLGGAQSSLWLVEMPAGIRGPEHSFAGEIVWSLTAGSGIVRVGEVESPLEAGDTVVIPAGELRQFTAGSTGFSGVVTVREGEAFLGDGSSAGVPPWVA
ncbi:cupin domain-containing protein [Flexivirga oryzae]|uniref:Quercetin dioxygenase-like cupin family protein n=1 Tax=Flexivirga oryzae TaxID=1794944 RepID=A0A839N2Q4_9MICO|nr:cupin domain-containing protein [Flexivirga oryzae]MBB2890374.1 quercetin dioxygenase-like cupin family protein [Flexivirga oryzae]